MKDMDCYKGLRLTKILFYGGLGLMVTGLMIGTVGEREIFMTACGVFGFLGALAGWLCCVCFVRCPECGESLMPGYRIPGALAHFCPNCGKEL